MAFSIDDMRVIKWYVGASFAVRPSFKSHTGGIMVGVTGATQSGSVQQELNTRSSTKAEVVGVDDVASNIFWTIFLLRIKVTMLKVIFFTKITRVLSS